MKPAVSTRQASGEYPRRGNDTGTEGVTTHSTHKGVSGGLIEIVSYLGHPSVCPANGSTFADH
jgi:hypothetical protein